jgi:CRP/FNR family transcriptional regulator, cAMP and macrophage regulator
MSRPERTLGFFAPAALEVDEDSAWMAKFFGVADAAPMSTLELAQLSRYFRSVSLRAGTVLFAEGTIPKGVWVLQSGSVELFTRLGGRPAVIRILSSGESLGDIQLLTGRPARYKARAADACIALFATAGDLERLFIEAPSVARRWISKLSLQVDRNQDRIVELLGGSLEEKVARCLTDESREHEFPFSQSTLAAMLGVHRSSVNPVLKVFEAQGLIALGYRRITVLAPRHLSRIARRSTWKRLDDSWSPPGPDHRQESNPSITESEPSSRLVWRTRA